jgi:glucose-6-phosphate 1-dehydrogenase
MRLQPVVMEFSYGSSFGMPSPEAYERLLLDAMRGDATLFTRDDEIEESWDSFGSDTRELEFARWSTECTSTRPDREGPTAAATLLKPGGHSWRRL